eukprot:SAG11_NODE_23139_length_394_cov_1.162712_1_plen_57_part_00
MLTECALVLVLVLVPAPVLAPVLVPVTVLAPAAATWHSIAQATREKRSYSQEAGQG